MRKDLHSQPFTFSSLFEAISGPTPDAEVEAAAAALAALPRTKSAKKWTGYLVPGLKSSRLWRGRKVITPGNRVVEVYGARRGLVLTCYHDPFIVEPVFQMYPAKDLIVYKLSAAVRLGQAKRGVKEKQSDRKKESCRRNGRQPCHNGQRGRITGQNYKAQSSRLEVTL